MFVANRKAWANVAPSVTSSGLCATAGDLIIYDAQAPPRCTKCNSLSYADTAYMALCASHRIAV